MKKIVVTPALLRKLVVEEAAKLAASTEEAAKDTTEVDADELGTDKPLIKPIDWEKLLDLREAKVLGQLKKVRAAKADLKSKKVAK